MILALMLVYMVLACQHESLRDPSVMCSVPMAAIGVLLTSPHGHHLNVQPHIGCIMLGGIVVSTPSCSSIRPVASDGRRHEPATPSPRPGAAASGPFS